IAVTAVIPPGMDYGAVGRRINRRAVGAGKVDAGVERGAGVERIGPGAEPTGEFDVGLDRLVGWDGNDSILELIELLPAVDQALEGGAGSGLKRTADTGGTANARRRDPKALQLRGGDLI